MNPDAKTAGDSKALLLKLLTGPHAGATLPLAPGVYEIGRSDRCDIILNDPEIAPRHARLVVSGSQVELVPLAQPLLVNGQPLYDMQAMLQRLQPVTVGGTMLAVGVTDDDWVGLLDGGVAPADSPAGNASAGGPASGTAAATHMCQAAAQLAQIAHLPKVQTRRAYSMGAGFLLVACVLLVVTAANTKPAGNPEALRAPLAQVHRIVTDLQLPLLDITTDRNGIVKISGYVDNSRQRQRLDRALRPLGNRIRHRIWAQDDMLASVDDTLRQLGVSTIRAVSAAKGKVMVSGYIGEQQRWAKIKKSLQEDVSGVLSIDDTGIDSLQDRLTALRERVSRKKLGEKLQLAITDEAITVLGALSPADLKRWRGVERQFKKDFGGLPALRVNINQAPDLKLAIRGVSIGIAPFITTTDGGKFMEGSTLSNGYVVKSIRPDRLILSKDNQSTVYYLGGK